MDIKIRKIEEQDFPALIELFQEFADFENHSDDMNNSVEQMQTEKEHVDGFVALKDGKIIAYTTCFFSYHTWVGKCLYMDDLYVQPEHRGSGLGSQLINKNIEYAKEEKCRKMRWQVSDWNKPAKEFYKNLGATISPVEQNCVLQLS